MVFAFGSPQGLENSVTMGVVSATARQVSEDNPTTYVQTDAPINPGNSGGPLVDVDGRVVGIDTFILSESGGSEGLGFAIPSNVVRNIYEQLKTEGHVHRGQIGVYLRTITPDLAEGLKLPRSHGVLLEDVAPGSSADKAGLKVGEVVTSIGGKPVGDVKEFATLLFAYKIGQVAPIGVLRNGKEVTVEVTVAERPDDPQRFADMVTGPGNVVERLGIVGVTINDDLKRLLPDLRIPSGVIVAARTPSSDVAGRGAGGRRRDPRGEHHSHHGHCRAEAGAARNSVRRFHRAADRARRRTELPGDGVGVRLRADRLRPLNVHHAAGAGSVVLPSCGPLGPPSRILALISSMITSTTAVDVRCDDGAGV